mmetsp:Transcript_25143/g.48180  ORF Transcript_25143/g.48180 Transcript_25143/m.48180 type:complete len:90 (-) Transcript_25143:688-957(-)
MALSSNPITSASPLLKIASLNKEPDPAENEPKWSWCHCLGHNRSCCQEQAYEKHFTSKKRRAGNTPHFASDRAHKVQRIIWLTVCHTCS